MICIGYLHAVSLYYGLKYNYTASRKWSYVQPKTIFPKVVAYNSCDISKVIMTISHKHDKNYNATNHLNASIVTSCMCYYKLYHGCLWTIKVCFKTCKFGIAII